MKFLSFPVMRTRQIILWVLDLHRVVQSWITTFFLITGYVYMHSNIPNMIFNTANVSSIILFGFSCSTLTMFPLSDIEYADITQVLGACVGH